MAIHHPQTTFPFLQIIASQDLLACPPPTAYDPSALHLPADLSFSLPQRELKKEEATEPGYILPEPSSFPANFSKEIAIRKERKLKNVNENKEDSDYQPTKCNLAPKKPFPKQKQDRNLIPNTVRQLLSFIQQQYKSKYLLERFFSRLNPHPAYTVPRFYNFHRMLRGRVNNYVNETAMQDLLHEGVLAFEEYDCQEQRFYCKVSRVMARHYLRTEAMLLTLTSKKVRKENRLDHLTVQRFLYENMICSQP